jgi:squalene-hopene/tetraprenyl-beta-curcumene cyclase
VSGLIQIETAPLRDVGPIPCPPGLEGVADALARGREHLFKQQRDDAHWVFPLEADATITAEYVIFRRLMGIPVDERDRRAAEFLLATQQGDGGWSRFEGAPGQLSLAVEAYFALKLVGHRPDEPALARARDFVLSAGGVERSGVFTRIWLSYFGEFPERGVPVTPVEIVLLPNRFPLSIYEMSSWARGTVVPLAMLQALRFRVPSPGERGVRELWREAPEQADLSFDAGRGLLTWRRFFSVLDRTLHALGRATLRRPLRARALREAERWVRERQDRSGGWGGIVPAMLNSTLALRALRGPEDDAVRRGLQAVEDFTHEDARGLMLQPCVSPVWDTPIAMNALFESGLPSDHGSFRHAADWLFRKQTSTRGDWKVKVPDADPGGWYFQFENEFYPDNDDTSMVLLALLKVKTFEEEKKLRRITAAFEWLMKMQCSDGGWGAFDKDNNKLIFNHIPFADHGALLDPSTSDLTGRALEIMGLMGLDLTYGPAKAAHDFILREQEQDGSWYGRWGVNYIYGTWSVLAGLKLIGEDMDKEYIRKAVRWLKSRQHEDGGWGESCDTYRDPHAEDWRSTVSQTSWALIGLISAGEAASHEVKRGIGYLLHTQNRFGYWDEEDYTGTGFPRVFYLRYHMYSKYFPLWALSSYHSIITRGRTRTEEVRLENRQKGTYGKFFGR